MMTRNMPFPPATKRRFLLAGLLAVCLQPADLPAQRDRDDWQRVPDVVAALAISEGSQVADVGAGSGYFTEHLARAVGANGRVFAVDISDRAISQLQKLARDEGFENVVVVRGEVDDPRLPHGSLDAVLVVDSYHEMTEHAAMLAGMYDALNAGGRLVMLDRVPSNPSLSRHTQTSNHDLSIAIAERELREAGFEILERHEKFAERRRNDWQWMLVGRR